MDCLEFLVISSAFLVVLVVLSRQFLFSLELPVHLVGEVLEFHFHVVGFSTSCRCLGVVED